MMTVEFLQISPHDLSGSAGDGWHPDTGVRVLSWRNGAGGELPGRARLGRNMPPPGRKLGAAARMGALVYWLAAVAVPCDGSAPLFSGSLTWQVHPHFAAGVRQVEFILDTSFEMDLSGAGDCQYAVGEAVSCADGASRWGRLCVDQYRRIPGAASRLEALNPYETEAECPGADNAFIVKKTAHINGANIVFGRLTHTVTAQPEAFALIAFLSTGRMAADEDAGAISAGTLMPQCSANMTVNMKVPCSVNTHHRQYNDSLPIEFGLFKTPTRPQAKELKYYGSLRLRNQDRAKSWAARDEKTGLYRQFPSLETLVALCATMPANTQFKCDAKGEELRNYYSPRPVIPGVIEVAVTPFTQSGVTSQNPSGGVKTHAFPAITQEREPFRYWHFPGHRSSYSAPHPPLYLKAFDLDG